MTMAKTIAEKVLGIKSGKDVQASDYITADVDMVMVHIGLARMAPMIEELGLGDVWDPERIVALEDHYVPAPSVAAAELHKTLRKMVKMLKLKHFYGLNEGICHQVMVEKGHILPGMIVLGTDSHSTTYGALGALGTGIGVSEMVSVFKKGRLWFRVPESIKVEVTGKFMPFVAAKDLMLELIKHHGVSVGQYRSIEFCGEAVDGFTLSERMTLANMSVEMGAKFGVIPPDERVINYLERRKVTPEPLDPIYPDEDAVYVENIISDITEIEPNVACPHTMDNVKKVSDVSGIRIDQAFIGSCTNGRMDDLRAACEIIKGEEVSRGVRVLVSPASREVYLDAMKEGLLEEFLDFGAMVLNPSCGPCFGAHMGLLASGERCITSTSRNFKGRMGSQEAELYVASPQTVAASAVEGQITDPRDL